MPVIPPLHAISEIATFKRLNDPERPFEFAEISIGNKKLRYCISSPTSRWRVDTLFTKEPGTIDWLNSFKPGDVFVDIGANIGMYSLYAAVISGAKVFSFEPEAQNYAELNRSIFLNAAFHSVSAYCVAITDEPVRVSKLLLSDVMIGKSFHDFDTPSRDYDARQRITQGCVGFSLDHLLAMGALPIPAHIKIDVDGLEYKVMRGMQKVLELDGLRTVLLECDPTLPHTAELVCAMLSQGWHVNPDQLRFSSQGLRPAETVMDEMKAGKYVGNIIFGRKPEDVAFASAALQRFNAQEVTAMEAP